MASIPKRIHNRLSTNLKKYQPIVNSARSRDLNESDTVILITDIFADLFGYDKYSEITSEHAIRGTYCDLALVIDGAIVFIIEVKAIGTDLKEAHIKQAVDYGANQGTEWIVLTNGINWQIYKIHFQKPVQRDLFLSFDFLSLNPKNINDIESLYLLCRESLMKSSLTEYYVQKKATDKFTVAAILLSDPVLNIIRRELKRINPRIKIQSSEIQEILTKEVIKREVVEGDKADVAQKKIKKAPVRKRTKQKRISAEIEEVKKSSIEIPPTSSDSGL